MNKEKEKAKEIFTLMTIGKMTVTEINSLTDVERFLLSKCFIEKVKEEEDEISNMPGHSNPPPPKKSKDFEWERKKWKEQTQYLGNRTWKWW